jgi:hypothetical protein
MISRNLEHPEKSNNVTKETTILSFRRGTRGSLVMPGKFLNGDIENGFGSEEMV